MRRAAKRDKNEAAICLALEQVGATVTRLSDPGVPDLLIGYRGATVLIEVKAPIGPKGGTSHAPLTPEQLAWWQAWKGATPHIVRTPAEALAAIGVYVNPERRGAVL